MVGRQQAETRLVVAALAEANWSVMAAAVAVAALGTVVVVFVVFEVSQQLSLQLVVVVMPIMKV